jgi:hypothetical protein
MGIVVQATPNHGWSYGSILGRPEERRQDTHASIAGWFPTSYVTNYVAPSTSPRNAPERSTATYENDIWNTSMEPSPPQNSIVYEDEPMGIPSSSSDASSTPPVYIPRPPPVLADDDDDDGFNAIPMGYDQPQSYDEPRNPLPYRPEEEPADEALPEGVKVVPVPGRRHLHSYIPLAGGRKLMRSLHQNAVQPIVTKVSRKKKDAPVRPAVFISP